MTYLYKYLPSIMPRVGQSCLIVEYAYSTVDDCIKVVECTRVDESGFKHFHILDYMDTKDRGNLMKQLYEEYSNKEIVK